MMRGETILIRFPTYGQADAFGQTPVSYSDQESVDDVLVEPASGQDAIDDTMPHGVEVAYTLRFPRAWPYRRLKGAIITVRGRDCHVIGDPDIVDGGLTPTRWNMTVQVSRTEG